MKRILLLILFIMPLVKVAYTQSEEKDLYNQGLSSLQGIHKAYNPALAKQLFLQAAFKSDSRAMMKLGDLYSSTSFIKQNIDSAIFWYNSAANIGAKRAYFSLGRIYQLGIGIKQDFKVAAEYYRRGIAINESYAKNALGYLYFKGLGVTQDYKSAFKLFKESAEEGLANSMYFLGICYRNGYGIEVNNEQAKSWLRKASGEDVHAAIHEIYRESTPENASIVSSHLQDKLTALKGYTEKVKADGRNNYEGSYSGEIIYYDWSGRFVTEILPLKLNLQRIDGGYNAEWKEEGSDMASINLKANDNKFVFSSDSKYIRHDRYSGRTSEVWLFNKATLDLSFIKDSIQLSGYVQFYSPKRNEPGKPVQIILRRKMDVDPKVTSKTFEFKLFPNPASSSTFVQFEIPATADVLIKIYNQSGVLIYNEVPRKLPRGNYNFPIPTDKLTPGTYNVQMLVGNLSDSKILIKQ